MRWFGHVERMDEYLMARRVLMAEVSIGRVRGRPRFGWLDGVKVAMGNRGMTVEAVPQCAKIGMGGETWCTCNNEFHAAVFAFLCLPVLWWLSPG